MRILLSFFRRRKKGYPMFSIASQSHMNICMILYMARFSKIQEKSPDFGFDFLEIMKMAQSQTEKWKKMDRYNRKLFLICVTGLHLWEVTGQINGCILVES